LCVSGALYAYDINNLSPETIEIIKSNPSLLEKIGSDNATTNRNSVDRNIRSSQSRQRSQDNTTLRNSDNRSRQLFSDNASMLFDNNSLFPFTKEKPKPAVPDPFIKKELTYEEDNETKTIGVFGFVKHPNKYKVDLNFNILDSVAEADGPIDLELLQKVSVYRNGAEVADFTYTPKNIYVMSKYMLQDNDTIILEGKYETPEDEEKEEKEELQIFGHNIFVQTGDYFPDQNAINFSDYVLGPGDKLQIYLWGRLSKTLSLPVNSDGSVISNETGRVIVAGKRFADVSAAIKGILESTEGVNAEVLVENIKSIRVLVLGEVVQPGYYTVNSFNNISTAIINAGGVTEQADIRNVSVKNNGQVVSTVDFYDLIVNGDSSEDMLLKPGDTVFVPRTALRVSLEVKVRTPAYFDLQKNETLADLFKYAGGTAPGAYKKNIFLRSINTDGTVKSASFVYGQKMDTVRLKDGDSVYVMDSDIPDTNSVELTGNVYFEGMYSLGEGKRLSDILSGSDILKPDTALEYGYVERFKGAGKSRQFIGFNLEKILNAPDDHGNNIKLEPMDIIHIMTRDEVMASAFVTVTGEVNAQGKYKMPEFAYVYDAIMQAGGFAVDAAYDNIEVVRKIGSKYYTRFLDMEEARKLELNPDDSIVVHAKWESAPKGYVDIEGEVNSPGSYILSEGLTLSELVKKAGGLKKEAYKDVFQVFRVKDGSFNYSMLRYSLDKAMNGSTEDNLVLKDGDKVFIHSVFEFNPQKSVKIIGAVNVPGKYIYADNMSIKDLIIAAGNFKDNAYMDVAEIVRMYVENGSTKYSVIDVNLNNIMSDIQTVKIEPYDQVLIKEISGFKEESVVTITGEVLFPGEYVITKGEKLSNILSRAGGVTDYAYVSGIQFFRESVKKVESENLKALKLRLENTVTAMASQEIASSLSAEDVTANKALSQNLENMIKKLDEIEPTGRVVIDIDSLKELNNSSYDFELENGDVIDMPARKSTVSVLGEVFQATSFAYDDQKNTVYDYINKSGGITDIADEKNIYVVKANGSIISNRYINDNYWWKDIYDLNLNPGDVVIVPRRLKFPSYMRDIKDVTQILYQIATTFAVTKLMY
jgi:protein involved in polysaccharide export with SLBB domain